MKILIVGPMSKARRAECEQSYEMAAKAVKDAGQTPVSPMDDHGYRSATTVKDRTKAMMRLLFESDAMLLLFNWFKDPSCRVADYIAKQVCVPEFTNFASLKLLHRPLGSMNGSELQTLLTSKTVKEDEEEE